MVKKVDELRCVASMTDPDIILVTESWCNSEISNAFLAIDGYELQQDLRTDREDTAGGRGGGLLVYGKTGLTILKLDKEVEMQQYCVFKVSNVTFYLLYRSPNAPPQTMAALTELVRSVKRDSVLIGDFNLPDINWDTGEASARTREFKEAVDDALMEQMVDFQTQVRGNMLDLVLTNIPERVIEVSEGGRLGQSDHEMIQIKVSDGQGVPTSGKEVKNWRRADWQRMRSEMGRVNWQRVLSDLSVEEKWNFFKAKVTYTVKKNVPTRKVNSKGRPAWMTREIMAAIRRKKTLWSRVKGGTITEEYREADKAVKRLIRNAKRKFEKKLAEGCNGNSRPFYSYVKKKTKSRQSVGPLRDRNAKVVTEDEEMAEVLNGFFSSVFTREDETNIPRADDMETEEMRGIRVTEWEVKKKIRKLRKDAAAGPDEIGPRVLQELENEIAPALVMIFRHSLSTGEIPADWKRANVTPIFKKGTKADPGNYRPVSLTSVCCKILETLVRDGIMSHLESNNLISQEQHGFLPGKSCCTNLLEFMEKVTSAVDEGVPYDVIFLDFAKAFDKVPRERLLEKLRAHGIRGKTLLWIRNWLSGRTQRVVINGKCSGWREVLSGVPQGSVLGPILFLIFINDLGRVARMIDALRKFADDTKLGQRAETMQERESMQEALDNLCQWADTWGMQFNVGKCKVMHFGHRNLRHKYKMNGQELQETEEEVDIGVMVTKDLKPSGQCRRAARTAQTVLGQLARAFSYRDRHIFMKLYVQYVRPHLEFSVQAWSPWTEADKECLEKVQRRAVGMVSGLAARDYEERLRELGHTTLEERRHQLDMQQVHRILVGKDKVKSETWFKMASDIERVTRAAADPLNLRIPAPRLEVRKNFFSQRVPECWNKIPQDLKQAATAKAFRNAYQKHRQMGASA